MSSKLPYPLAMLQRGESHDPFSVLGRQPDHADARFNRSIVSAALAEEDARLSGTANATADDASIQLNDRIAEATPHSLIGELLAPASGLAGPLKRRPADADEKMRGAVLGG